MKTQEVDQTSRIQRVAKTLFGVLEDGREVDTYTLTNTNGIVCQVITYGATITRLHLPDRVGKFDDIVLGYDNLKSYCRGGDYVGATIGRVANRIRGGRFRMDAKEFVLTRNEGCHHLHGGFRGFDKEIWNCASVSQSEGRLCLKHKSAEGTEGYPGNLTAYVNYTLTDQDELRIDYEATTDTPTPVNFTNHTYFNLAGTGNVLDHHLQIEADYYTPMDKFHIPTGTIATVGGTETDFRQPVPIRAMMKLAGNGFAGHNYNYVLNGGGGRLAKSARIYEPGCGRCLELWTDQPGIQFYSGCYLRSGIRGKNGFEYGPYSGLCLEPQQFPDAVNHPNFPPILLDPSGKYQHRTVWKFLVE